MSTIQINPQRSTNFWEPIYDPNEKEYKLCAIPPEDFDHIPAIDRYVINWEYLSTKTFLEDKTFTRIDFIGNIDGDKLTKTFRNCQFVLCSFRSSEIKNIKFSNCNFDRTTFSLARFINCEFRNCQFHNIGISGNATQLENIYIDPEELLKNLYLCKDKDLLKERKTNIQFQKMMQMKTKSVIARKILTMKPVKADIDMLIRAIRSSRKYETKSKLAESLYNLKTQNFIQKWKHLLNFVYYILELPVLCFFGWLSGWGQKAGKTVLFGICGIFLFALFYAFIGYPKSTNSDSLMKSIEYTLLFGYTKYPFVNNNRLTNTVVLINAIFGMLWYASLIPIIINKLGKDDE